MTLRLISESCKTPKQNPLETHRIVLISHRVTVVLTLVENDAQQGSCGLQF